MAYRELKMIDVKEVLRRWAAGQSNRQIAKQAGVHRDTVARYAEVAVELGWARDPSLALTDAQVHEVAARVQARPQLDSSEQWQEVAAHAAQIREWLERKRPLRLTKVHALLVRQHELKASYDTLRRYARHELGWQKKATTVRVVDPPAGQEAQIDFGKMGMMLDPATGRVRALWVLIVTLSFSRYQFVWPTFVQTTAAVCEGLDAAWAFFGAMARTIVPDNMKAIVKEPDALKPILVRAFLDYAQARDLFVDPARVRSPKDKARVENQVPYVRESWFDGETFADMDAARRSAATWCRDIAGARVHGSTRRVPREVFESTERAAMLPAPTSRFDVPTWREKLRVQTDHHVQVEQALYSVPSIHVGKEVSARADTATVRIYLGTEQIKMHERQPIGGCATDPTDYPEGKADYAFRSIDRLISAARAKGVHVGQYADRLLGGVHAWTRARQARALLRLCETFGDGRVEAICQSALAFDVVDVTRVERMLQSATTPAQPQQDGGKVVRLPLPRFARPDTHFETRSSTKETV